MKKVMLLVLILLMVFTVAGCGKNEDASSYENVDNGNTHFVYDFPEPTYHIVVNYNGEGKSKIFEFGTEEYSEDGMVETFPIAKWFYDLEIQPESISAKDIEQVDGNEVFTFIVNGEEAFWYDSRGSEAYLCVDGQYFVVSNPSNPITENN